MKNSGIYGDGIIKCCLSLMLCIGVLSGVGVLAADLRPYPPGNLNDNIALNKPYTTSPAPNSTDCGDSGDVTQLTDGFNYTGGSSLWTQMSTVGWQYQNGAITIDLGVVQPVKGIEFYTAAGTSGVYWPSAIDISLSNDGTNFYSVGNLVSLTENGTPPAYGTYNRYCFKTTALSTFGRYVKLSVTRNGIFIFADEIKVIRGANSILDSQKFALQSCTITMTPSPNATDCTDASDRAQLTDGVVYTGTDPLWLRTATVGWQFVSGIEIKVDLGSVLPIGGLAFHTAGGTAGGSGVTYPIAITVLVSSDDSTYYKAGELVSLSAEHGYPTALAASGSVLHTFWTDRLCAYGRYVKIIPSPGCAYLFTDEIEMYVGRNQFNGPVVTDLATVIKKDQIRGGSARRIGLDIKDVQQQTDAQSGLSQAVRDQIKALLTTSTNEIMYLADADPATFKAKMPLNGSHANVFSALQQLWYAQGKSGLIGWLSLPWDFITLTQQPGSVPASNGISVKMMTDEYRTAAFNLSNASGSDMNVSLNITGLPGGTNPSYIKVKEVPWTDTLAGIPLANALSDAATDANGYVINVPSGMTRQVCLTFHPTSVTPGKYGIFSGSITAGTVTVPVTLNLSGMSLPTPTISLGGWDETDLDSSYGAMTLTNRAAFIALLREYFVDTTCANSALTMPNVDYTKVDAWMQRWTGVRNYQINIPCGTTFNGYDMGTSQFNAAVATWINAYASHWTGMGLNLNQIKLLLHDEPRDANGAAITTNWANAIKAAQPGLKIWTDPIFPDPTVSYAQTMFAAVDILCPNRQNFMLANDTYRNTFRNAGKMLHFYSCSYAGLLDPYSYYRLQAWTCWAECAYGAFYWGFTDTGYSSSWNEYNAKFFNSSPIFLDPNDSTVVAGKKMEAIREGIEDYEYLHTLQNRIDVSSGHPDASAAQTLVNGAAAAVLNATGASDMYLSTTQDRTIADQKRIEVLDMLEKLNNLCRGKTYTMSPAPNSSDCSDSPGDTTQLTDGTIYTGGSSFWTQMSTVGWQYLDATITIDLGTVKSLKGVAFHTGAGTAGVYFPSAISIAVSSNGSSYTTVGDLVSLSNSENGNPPAYGTYNRHCFQTRSLNTSGRYVKLTITRSGTFIFVDEIKVLGW